MEPTVQSSSSDVYYVEDNNENVYVYHTEEQEDIQEEEILDQSIDTDDLSWTADLSDGYEPIQLFSMNCNNSRQQKSP